MSAPLCLVALEDPAERSSIASLFWAHGFEVRQVSSDDMALRLLRRGRPIDLVVAENGVVVGRARSEGLSTPFLVVSKPAGESAVASVLERVRVIERPIDEVRLEAVVPELLGDRWRRAMTFAEASAEAADD